MKGVYAAKVGPEQAPTETFRHAYVEHRAELRPESKYTRRQVYPDPGIKLIMSTSYIAVERVFAAGVFQRADRDLMEIRTAEREVQVHHQVTEVVAVLVVLANQLCLQSRVVRAPSTESTLLQLLVVRNGVGVVVSDDRRAVVVIYVNVVGVFILGDGDHFFGTILVGASERTRELRASVSLNREQQSDCCEFTHVFSPLRNFDVGEIFRLVSF